MAGLWYLTETCQEVRMQEVFLFCPEPPRVKVGLGPKEGKAFQWSEMIIQLLFAFPIQIITQCKVLQLNENKTKYKL